MILRFLGQSGFLLQSDRTRILIDPYFSDIVGRLHGRPRLLPVPLSREEMPCHAVFCTHDHLDHLDPDTAQMLPPDQLFYTTPGGCQTLAVIGRLNAKSLTLGQAVCVGDFSVTPVFAAHTVEAFGLLVQAEGYTLYFSGDTLFDERLYEIREHKPDISFICINGRLGNMDTDQAVYLARVIGAKTNIPHHYDMFASNSADPACFADRVPGGKILSFNTDYPIETLV